jgi:hypothetical protein
MKKRPFLLALLLLCLLPLAAVQAQEPDITILTDNLTLDFPSAVTFHLSFTSDSPIETINLYYGTQRRTCTGQARVRVDFNAASEGEVSWEWDLGDSGDLPPGAVITWRWLLVDAEGRTFETDEQSFHYEDPNYHWQSIGDETVTIVWAEGSTAFAWEMHRLVMDAIQHLEQDAGIAPDGPVRMTIYPSSDAMVEASVHLPEWAGGVAFTDYNLIVAGIPEDNYAWAEDVIAHEIGHLVSHTLVFNCLGARMPTWLDEGISRFAEGPAKPHEVALVISKLEAGELPTLRSLAQGFAADPDAARLSYAQSDAVVRFLIEEYGQENLSRLLQEIKAGNKIDAALETVYGFNTEGLDSLFRIHMGFDPLPGYDPDATPTPRLENTPVPTLALATPFPQETATEDAAAQPTPTSTPTQEEQPKGTPTLFQPSPTTVENPFNLPRPRAGLLLTGGLICGGILILAVIGALILILARRRKNQANP